MKILCLIALLAGLPFASAADSPAATPETPAPAPQSAPLSELHRVKLENLMLRQSILTQNQNQLNESKAALMAEVCKEANIEHCQLSQDLKTAIEIRPRPVAPTAPVDSTKRNPDAPRTEQQDSAAKAPSPPKGK